MALLRVNILDPQATDWLRPAPPFWYPLYVNRRRLKHAGIRIRYYAHLCPELRRCDVLFVSSRFFHLEAKSEAEKGRSLDVLEQLKRDIGRVVWFDVRDSSGNTQFEVLPFVDRYLKRQLLRDRSRYAEALYGNRVYTDYFHRRFGTVDSYEEAHCPLRPEDEAKLGISWNLGLGDTRGGGSLAHAWCRLRDGVEPGLRLSHSIPLTRWQTPRDVDLVALFQTTYERSTIAQQRRLGVDALKRLDHPGVLHGSRLSPTRYRRALARAKMVLSLFGWGELCIRDSETFTAGAALVMPEVSHLETWPEFYVSRKTYWPLRWDLDDLAATFARLLEDEGTRLAIAREGQERYRHAWSEAGMKDFRDRLRRLIDNVVSTPG